MRTWPGSVWPCFLPTSTSPQNISTGRRWTPLSTVFALLVIQSIAVSVHSTLAKIICQKAVLRPLQSHVRKLSWGPYNSVTHTYYNKYGSSDHVSLNYLWSSTCYIILKQGKSAHHPSSEEEREMWMPRARVKVNQWSCVTLCQALPHPSPTKEEALIESDDLLLLL